MNILDENIPAMQRQILRSWRVPVRHIGNDTGRKGMTDEEIIPFLLAMRRPTLFTLDWDFYHPDLCHSRYCLVVLDVGREESAFFVRRLLVNPELDTQANRMGAVVRASYAGLYVWRLHAPGEVRLSWKE
jgi:hypothetical protein